MARQIVLDTETTGLSPENGDRLIEIGCVELIDRKLTGNNLHLYINPQRIVDKEAIDIHGITNDFLIDKPIFTEVVDQVIDYAPAKVDRKKYKQLVDLDLDQIPTGIAKLLGVKDE